MEENTMEVDVVIIWVDGNDPDWQMEFNKYTPVAVDESNHESRFRDFGTLRYVLRGISVFMPWIRKIHFITSGHKPEWLDINHPKINFLTHHDIFYDKSHLPVFNSASIELNFLGIDDLADHFIYFNDDMLVLNETPIERFFKNTLPVDFMIENILFYQKQELRRYLSYIKNGFKEPAPNFWIDHKRNDVKLINSNFKKKDQISLYRNKKADNVFHNKYYSGEYHKYDNIQNRIANVFPKYYIFYDAHVPQPLRKKTLEEVFTSCKYKILETSASKFRTASDINQYIYRYWHLVKSEYSPIEELDMEIYFIKSIQSAYHCINDMENYRVVCINDCSSLIGEDYHVAKKLILKALEKILPQHADFELMK